MSFTKFIDPYIDWSLELAAVAPQHGRPVSTHAPVYLEGRQDKINDAFVAAGALVFLGPQNPHSDQSATRLMRDGLVAQASGPEEPNAISDYYYMPLSDLAKLGVRTKTHRFVKAVGAPLYLDPNSAGPVSPVWDLGVSKPASLGPIVAVIDEGIAYLNERFQKVSSAPAAPAVTTRIMGLWQQSMKVGADLSQPEPVVTSGRVLTASDIEADIAQLPSMTEQELYRLRNDEIFFDHAHRSTEQGFSHGTAILDLAAGADPVGTEDQADILAVQLPPDALEDTSGAHVQAYLLMGLDWLLSVARDQQRAIVVNVSLGFPTGNKGGSGFLEQQVRSRIAAHNAAMDQDQAGQVVFAYGNSFLDRLAAQIDYRVAGFSEKVSWTVQPDDPTASFLHIHVPNQDADDINELIGVTIRSPDGTAFAIAPRRAGYSDLILDGGLVGRAYQDRLEDLPRLVIALAPSYGPDGAGLIAPFGDWSVEVTSRLARKTQVVLQVQRDDTAAGFAQGGRQSYLDHPNAYFLEPETQDYLLPFGQPGITRFGTNSAMMTHVGDACFLAGGLRPMMHASGAFEPSFESAGSDDWSSRETDAGPTHSVQSEDSIHNGGVVAAGSFSGTTVLVDGTSVATAKLTRELSGYGPRMTPVLGLEASSRLGQTVLAGAGGARPRHPEN
ncbi:MAG: S8 family serine peptidase [Pseudomonadota bacterium]